jgi:ATP-dependent DNA helicase RecG
MNPSTPISQAINTTKSHLKKLEDLGVKSISDLLLYFPRTYEDKREYSKIAEITTDKVVNIKGRLSHLFHKRTGNGKHFTKAIFSDDSGSIEVVWFNQSYLKRLLKNGDELMLSGKAKYNQGKLNLPGPSFEEKKAEQVHVGRIVPVYHQTDGITSKWIRDKIKPLINEWLKSFPEYLPAKIIEKYKLINYAEAIREAHFPGSEEELAMAKKRLGFDELFLLQLKALQKKWHWQNIARHQQKSIPVNPKTLDFIGLLPYELTNAQKTVVKEIMADLAQNYPMSRLLQGDVGSGKTIVAAIAILNTILSGYQAALMAPTEILAGQHFNTLFDLLKPFGFNIKFLSGSTPESEKNEIINQSKAGTVDLLIGTHALIQEQIGFLKLGLAVIDEQHRFGVKQREILKSKGSPHLLNLSATPIPRTLAITIYGDQDLSVIDEMPKGRREILTRVVPENKRTDAYRWIEDQITKGRQAFIICPLIDESDVLELKSAISEYEFLQTSVFKDLKLGLLHGKMKANEKEETMKLFKNNSINILVSTSVIEVGIDVPNASIMVIEGSERFGLSQLHQFRGRVGRGQHQSYCFLFTKSNSEEARLRLQAMVQHSSGFKLSEIDLSIRGPGEIFGIKQSGIPDLKMASLTDSITINLAREAAKEIITEDPELNKYPLLAEKINELPDIHIND